MNAKVAQAEIKQLLELYFDDVRLEWTASIELNKTVKNISNKYAPRTDIAVGPFYSTSKNSNSLGLNLVPINLRTVLLELSVNKNPSCLLAIEVVYSGSSKHLLGDILNSSILGLYGIIVCSPEIKFKVLRNIEYLRYVFDEYSSRNNTFKNVCVFDFAEFKALFQ